MAVSACPKSVLDALSRFPVHHCQSGKVSVDWSPEPVWWEDDPNCHETHELLTCGLCYVLGMVLSERLDLPMKVTGPVAADGWWDHVVVELQAPTSDVEGLYVDVNGVQTTTELAEVWGEGQFWDPTESDLKWFAKSLDQDMVDMARAVAARLCEEHHLD